MKQPWWEVSLNKKQAFDRITILEQHEGAIQEYRLEYLNGKKWTTLFEGKATPGRLKQHTFPSVKAEKVRITVLRHQGTVKIAEFGVYAAL